jgi:BA14K-like protein
MRVLKCVFWLSCSLVWATPAFADKSAYCAAYAQDFADARATSDRVLWQHKYDIALQACNGSSKPQNKPMVARIPNTAKKVVTSDQPVAPKKVNAEPAPASSKLVQLKPGSADWNTYCTNKYTSFNAKTGTYMSKTGVERKCVVSPS